MSRSDLSAKELGQWVVAQINSEPVGDRFNYGACDALYRSALKFGELTDEEDAAIRRVLDKHRKAGPDSDAGQFTFPKR